MTGEINQQGHGAADESAIIQRTSKAAFGVADLLVRLDCAVGIEKQNPRRAAVCAPVVIEGCPYGQVIHAVAIEIAQRDRRDTEEIAIIQRAGEAAFCVADLLVRQDPAGLSVGGVCDQRERGQRHKRSYRRQ